MKTKLDAVNSVLAAVRSAPINSLENLASPVHESALSFVEQADAEVQGKGWWYNTRQYSLPADIQGRIPVPPSFLLITPVHEHAGMLLVPDNGFMYDALNQTNIFTMTSLLAEVVVQLPWSGMPHSIRTLIAARAARRLNDDLYGEQNGPSSLKTNESDAYAAVMTDDIQFSGAHLRDPNINRHRR